ncbi:MAG: sigma-54 interaction domain-containing protein [bacterium]
MSDSGKTNKPRTKIPTEDVRPPGPETDAVVLSDSSLFEELLIEISTNLVAMDLEQTESYIPEILEKVSSMTGSELTTLLKIDQDSGHIQHSHQWNSPELSLDIDFVNFDLQAEAPWIASELLKLKPIPISKTSDFPKAAAKEKAIFEQAGFKSVLWVPAPISKKFSTCIMLNTLQSEIHWPELLIKRLVILGELIGNNLERGIAEGANRRQNEFEHLLTGVAASLVDVQSSEFDSVIREKIGSICQFFNISFGHILLHDNDDDSYFVRYEYRHSSISEDTSFLEVRVDESYPWLQNKLRTGQTFNLFSINDFPQEASAEREICEVFGIHSLLFVPFEVADFPQGFLVLNAMQHETHWEELIISRLKLAGEIFANALKRKKSDEKLVLAFSEIKILKEKIEAENVILRNNVSGQHDKHDFVGSSKLIRNIINQVEQVAATNATVLLMGETGTGKELLARKIHAWSARREKVMVTVNCAALPAELVESELFGHEKGAYTGAGTKQLGRFEIADGGTIFLDEIGDLPVNLQVKLLRVLQEGEFERLGSSKTINIDTRIIAATNRNLEQQVQSGDFREDLYYRLNVFPITIPPLRERIEDIPDIAKSILYELSEQLSKSVEQIPDEGMKILQQYSWPGNVRELRNIIERGIILSNDGEIIVNLPDDQLQYNNKSVRLEDAERVHILYVLQRSNWKISGSSGAAQMLGLKPTTLRSKMERLGITRPK